MSQLTYWMLYLMPVLGGFFYGDRGRRSEKLSRMAFIVLLVVAVGLRHNVGADWATYERFMRRVIDVPLHLSMGSSDRGYYFFNWISANTFGTVHFANVICAVLAVVPLALFCRSRSNPWLSLTVAVPYLIIVVFMGYTRQSAAIGLCLLAFMSLERAHFWRSLGWIILASLFHWSALGFALCICALSLVPFSGRNVLRSLMIGAVAAIFSLFLFSVQLSPPMGGGVPEAGSALLSAKVGIYVDKVGPAGFQSSGALIRLLMTAMAGAAMLLAIGWREFLNPKYSIWVLIAFASLALVPVSFFYSTLADRIGVFLIPLQLQAASVVDSAVPERFRILYRTGVMALFALVLFVWLEFSPFSQAWLPYDNVLFHLF